jgi:hypothetical protein
LGALVNILSFVFIATWLAAAVFLGTHTASSHDAVRIVAAVVVGVPGAAALAGNIRRNIRTGERTKERLKHLLRAALVEIGRSGVSADELTKISLHVWSVPLWYRVLIPYKVRRRIMSAKKRRLLGWLTAQPSLICLARYRIEHHDPTGVPFRSGVGLVGRCVDLNQSGQIHIVKLNSPIFKAAVKGDVQWQAAKETTTQNLSREAAQKLAGSYGEAAALVIRDTSGEAIGCVTLELPPDSGVHLPQPNTKSAKTHPLLKVLRSTTALVQNQLQRGKDN